jgi:hypothetical protein
MGFNVINCAADGFTTNDVLNGGKALLSCTARERAGDALPGQVAGQDTYEPLKHVEDLAHESGESGSMGITVVLSVGGNDIRHILADMRAVESTVKRLHANYAALLHRLLLLRPIVTTVICMQYCPCISAGALHFRPLLKTFVGPHPRTCPEIDRQYYGVYAAMATLPGPDSAEVKLKKLMRKVYAPIIVTAFEHGLALIDLPNTFDAKNNDLCATCCPPSRMLRSPRNNCDSQISQSPSPPCPPPRPPPPFPRPLKIYPPNRTVCLWWTPHRNSDVSCDSFFTYDRGV